MEVQGGAGWSDLGTWGLVGWSDLGIGGRSAGAQASAAMLGLVWGLLFPGKPEARALGPSNGAEGPLQAKNCGMKSREQGELRQKGCE